RSASLDFVPPRILSYAELPTLGTSFGVRETYCLSAAPRSVLGSSFPSHPLSYVLRAMHDLHPIGLRLYQEPNHLHIHDRYFLQIQNKQGSAMLELLFQFPDVLRFKVTNQTHRCLSTLRILFNLQDPPASIGASIILGQCNCGANAIH